MPSRCARLLGPRLAADLSLRSEIDERVKAARRGWFNLGKTWFQSLPWRLARLFFISTVYESAPCGKHVLLLNEKQEARLERVMVGMLRALLKGRKSIWIQDGSARPPATKEVWDHWHLAPVGHELAVRRLRWAQRMAKRPGEHKQPITALCGRCRIEDLLQVRRVSEQGWPIESSTP